MLAQAYNRSKRMTPTLQTARLVLEPPRVEDAGQIQARFPKWEIVRVLSAVVPWPYPADGAQRWLESAVLPAIECGEAWHWTLRLKRAPDQIIGLIAVQAKPNDKRGFWLDPEWQRGRA